ncbi:MAG TPA: Rieske 2Fe-2S domain-containing protein [Acidimicrobiales bacterium]|nr:Rieske 2Fe-2S domain-containing protein [Acidimicrobiales bacterium]
MPRRPDLLFDPGLRPKVRSQNGPRFPFPIPNGWFIVSTSHEVPVGHITPLHYFDRDLIVFRGESGEAHVTAAYCAHLGAHLGVGGKVRGEVVVCPFHGWCYDGESGACVEIPYGPGRIPSQAKVRAFPVVERNGMVWTWFHLEGKPPFYEVPEVPEIDDPDWSDPFIVDFTLNTVCQEMAENNHDPTHFQFVHGTAEIPDEDVHIDGTFKRVTSGGGTFIRETFGLGLGVLRITDSVTFISSTTPVDEEHVHVRWIFLTPATNGPDAARDAANQFTSGLSQDVPIWENKRYVERPVLLKEERSIVDHRAWCQQFYSDPSLAID